MTDFSRIFLDTSPIIYYLQENELYYSKMKWFWREYESYDYVTSAITITEYLTYPYKIGDLRMVSDFHSFLNGMEIEVETVNKSIAEKAAQIRAEYPYFKTMDSLQLATACISGCRLFLTNDKQLKQFQECQCIMVEELV